MLYTNTNTNLKLQSESLSLRKSLPDPLSELSKEDIDLSSYICSLPTRSDMENYVSRLETMCKTEISVLKTEVSNIGSRVNDIEIAANASNDHLDKHHEVLNEHTLEP